MEPLQKLHNLQFLLLVVPISYVILRRGNFKLHFNEDYMPAWRNIFLGTLFSIIFVDGRIFPFAYKMDYLSTIMGRFIPLVYYMRALYYIYKDDKVLPVGRHVVGQFVSFFVIISSLYALVKIPSVATFAVLVLSMAEFIMHSHIYGLPSSPSSALGSLGVGWD
jgi:hypothetical protein